MTVVAGIDVGNATTEAVAVAGGQLLCAARLPTRGRKGSADSIHGAAALVRRLERRLGQPVDEARVAPLRAVDTTTMTVPAIAGTTGRLSLLAAGVATPGGTGTCVGAPVWLDSPVLQSSRSSPPAVVVLVPAGVGYAQAAAGLRDLLAAGLPIGAVLVGSDEGVLIANRLGSRLPIIDQADTSAAAASGVLAIEVRPPGQPLTLLTDPVALGAALALDDGEVGDAAALSRALLDYSNAAIGLNGRGDTPRVIDEPWVAVRSQPSERIPLRAACSHLADWPVGSVRTLAGPAGESSVDDLFAVDLASVAEDATARRGSLGRAMVVAALRRRDEGIDHAGLLSGLLDRPVRCMGTEQAAARTGACTTPGARRDAVVVDLGAGTVDAIAPDCDVVAAGAGELLTFAVAETLGISRAAADWVKRGPCVRVEGGQRYEAEDGSRGFLDPPAARAAPVVSFTGMLAVAGPAGLLPFDRRHSPAVGRANVGGTLAGSPVGHRYAVALGLALGDVPRGS